MVLGVKFPGPFLAGHLRHSHRLTAEIGHKSLSVFSPERFCEYFSSYLPGDLALKSGGDFRWIFCGLRFLGNITLKILEKFGGKSEENSAGNPGRKLKEFGGLSVCNFSNLINPEIASSNVCQRPMFCDFPPFLWTSSLPPFKLAPTIWAFRHNSRLTKDQGISHLNGGCRSDETIALQKTEFSQPWQKPTQTTLWY